MALCTLAALRTALQRCLVPDEAEWKDDAEYSEVFDWARGYAPMPGKHYGPALDHARAMHAIAVDHWDAMDRKADDVTRYAGIALTAIAVVATVSAANLNAALFVPSFIAVLVGLLLAIWSRRPSALPVPGSARQVLSFAEAPRIQEEAQLHALIAASLVVATVGLRAAVDARAHRVMVASACLAVGLGLLLIPLCAAA